MSNEELLQPRYKVIATWPDSHLKVGYIEKWVSGLHVAKEFWCKYYDQYPHLFKKLEWWEDRRLEDMPEYIKFVQDYMGYKIGNVYKIENWSSQLEKGMIPFRFSEDEHGLCSVPPYFNQLMPALKDEYLNQSK